MKEHGMLKKKKFLTLLVADESAYQNCFLDSFLELALFLVRYEFILSEKKVGNNFLKRQFPPPGDISTQNSNGARYLDPKYSRWLSTDPALGEYVPAAGKGNANDAGNLPGMGGIYNSVNGNLYHYAGNNPIRYIDPDGQIILDADTTTYMQSATKNLNNQSGVLISEKGCTLTGYVRMAIALGADITLDEANQIAVENKLFDSNNKLNVYDGTKLVNLILKKKGINDVSISYEDSVYSSFYSSYSKYEKKKNEYFCLARIDTTDKYVLEEYGHTVNINSDALISYNCYNVPEDIRLNDTSRVNRTQLYGDSTGRPSNLKRLDFFKVIRTTSQDE